MYLMRDPIPKDNRSYIFILNHNPKDFFLAQITHVVSISHAQITIISLWHNLPLLATVLAFYSLINVMTWFDIWNKKFAPKMGLMFIVGSFVINEEWFHGQEFWYYISIYHMLNILCFSWLHGNWLKVCWHLCNIITHESHELENGHWVDLAK